MRCSFISCFFQMIFTLEDVVFLANAKEGIINRCCFYSGTFLLLYEFGENCEYSIPSASVNETVCSMNSSYSPIGTGSDEYTNHHSYLVRGGYTGCFELNGIPTNRDDINCFFFGSSCLGTPIMIFQGEKDRITKQL